MPQSYDNFIKLAIKNRPKTPREFLTLKKRICKELRVTDVPTNADLREAYERLIANNQIRREPRFEEILLSKRIRTLSGVAVIAVLTKPYPCPGHCLYCPTEKEMPKSYLSNEPAVMRAISAKFDPYVQVQKRIRALELNGHKTDKIELIVMGGTFSYFPKTYQKKFIKECFRACNDYPKRGAHNVKREASGRGAKFCALALEREKRRNEKARHRIIGLTLETRPDYIDQKEIVNFRNLGCTRVELGVQSVFDDILETNKRGHDIKKTVEATKLLKDAGFKINYHVMPGLPGSNLKTDREMFKKLFMEPDFQPDMLKIYPTVVIRNSELYDLWKKKKYKALTDKQFEKFILDIKEDIIPPYVRIARLVRDVPAESIEAGPKLSNLRQAIAGRSHCRCIRCREVKGNFDLQEKIILNRIDYDASDGKEIFLEYVSPDRKKLFALLRLRIPRCAKKRNKGRTSAGLKPPFPVLKGAALIREVHTYGKLTAIDKNDENSPQHLGLGKKLIKKAEELAKSEFGKNKIVIISGVGVRGYYRNLGYRLKNTYMLKYL